MDEEKYGNLVLTLVFVLGLGLVIAATVNWSALADAFLGLG